MNAKLVATMERRRGGASVIKLNGVIDEHHDLHALVAKVAGAKTLVNLAGVEGITARGTSAWVDWLASLASKGIRPELVACSPVIVEQLNRVKDFAGHGIVKSLQVPYHCTTCDRGKLLLVNIADLGKRPRAPTCRCGGCGGVMAFVDATGDYFAFIADLKVEPPKSETLPPQQLARGSFASVDTPTPVRISEPQVPVRASATYLSAAQVSGGRLSRPSQLLLDRTSQRQLQPPPPMPVTHERTILLGILGVLVAILGALIYLLGR